MSPQTGKQRIRRIWNNMKHRCYNQNDSCYHIYGARGITVCDEWLKSYRPFYDWAMANGYSDDLSIDRIDNNKGYSPDNCRWATAKQQAMNTSRNRLLTYNGQTKTLGEWAEESGVYYSKLRNRLEYGHPLEEAMNAESLRPIGRYSVRQIVSYNGETKTVEEWCKETGLHKSTVFRNLKTNTFGKMIDKKRRLNEQKQK